MNHREYGSKEDDNERDHGNGVSGTVYVIPTGDNNLSCNTSPSAQTYFKEPTIQIPDTDSTGFSWRKLWAFTGPGFLISIAFLDPGNIQCDLQAGTSAKYKLLWVVLWSTVLGLYIQWLSARIGVVTGLHLAEICYKEYKKYPRIFVWLMMEIAIIGSDMQEVIGTAIALFLLSDKRIPVWLGVLITVFDTFTFLMLDKYGLRKLEMFFAVLIAVMALSFGYEFAIVGQDTADMFKGLVIPYCSGCSVDSWLLGVGIVGAVIMPHNLYLHSGLVKSREIDRTKPEKVKEANMYFFIETGLALLVSLFINIFVLSVFAHELSGKTNIELKRVCEAAHSPYADNFANNTDLAEMEIYNGGVFLGCRFGVMAMYIWAIGILAAGQSSTMTGCYAGQFSMEGFLNLKWSRWKRVLFTRLVAILPTFAVAFYSNIQDLSGMNDLLNAIMSLQLPFAAIPTVAFSSNPRIMGQFVNGFFSKLLAIALLVGVLAINFAFVYFGSLNISDHWLVIAGISVYSIIYIIICIYLVVNMISGMFEDSS
ncbi:protein Malvolio-like isoform X2 [Lycorma delicatula]